MQTPLRLFSLLALSAPLAADITTRVSLTDAGDQSAGASGTAPVHAVAISGDATRVVFVAAATDLVPGDTNGLADVFVRDLLTEETRRVSVSTSGVQGDFKSFLPRISSNGRYVGFTSRASTLVPGDTNGWADVFVHDLATGTTERESVSWLGTQGNLNSESPSLSINGNYMLFWSNASNLVLGDTNDTGDVFLRDRFAGTVRRISLSITGGQANGNSYHGSIAAGGDYGAFASDATNLLQGDSNGVRDVFLWSRASGTLGRIDGGSLPNGASAWPTLSANGRYIAFTSEASNMIAGDTNGVADLFVYDRIADTIERVSVASGGGQANGASEQAWISEDAHFVVFLSVATNLVPGDTNGVPDVFLHDRWTGETRLMSQSTLGIQGNGTSFHCALSTDGRSVAFGSHSSNLVPGDSNFQPDVFLRAPERGPQQYCFGVGGVCPCDNAGTVPGGCANSASSTGAQLGWLGSTNALLDDLVLEARDLVPNQPALLFAGLDESNGGLGTIFGDGLRCARTSVIRLAVDAPDATGYLQFGPGLAAIGGWLPGDLRRFQVWYRDPQGPCGSGFNLTNGLRVDFGS